MGLLFIKQDYSYYNQGSAVGSQGPQKVWLCFSLRLDESLENDLKNLSTVDSDDDVDDADKVSSIDESLNKSTVNQFRFQRTSTNACLIVPNHFRISPMTEIEGEKSTPLIANHQSIRTVVDSAVVQLTVMHCCVQLLPQIGLTR